MDVEVRRIRESELEEAVKLSRTVLIDVWKRHVGDYCPRKALEEMLRWEHTLENYSRVLRDPYAFCFVAVAGVKIVGIAMGRIWGESGLAFLSWIGVHPDHQRKGVGTKLMREVLEHCKSRGCHKVTLYTMPVLRPAVNFYLKLGFVPEAYLHRHWWGADFIVMSKWLT